MWSTVRPVSTALLPIAKSCTSSFLKTGGLQATDAFATTGLLDEAFVLEEVQDGHAQLAPRARRPIDVKETGHQMRSGQDDGLARIEGLDRRDECLHRVTRGDLAGGLDPVAFQCLDTGGDGLPTGFNDLLLQVLELRL